jgi:hypothetical protein
MAEIISLGANDSVGNSGINDKIGFGITTPQYDFHIMKQLFALQPNSVAWPFIIQQTNDSKTFFKNSGQSRLVIDANGNFGFGVDNPINLIETKGQLHYHDGTASQSGTTITGNGTVFTSDMEGNLLIFNNGTVAHITHVLGDTELTVAESYSVSEQAYFIYYPGLNVTNYGSIGIGITAPTSTYKLYVNGAAYFSDNISLASGKTVDGVDISAIKLNTMPSAADGAISCNNQKLTNVAGPTASSDAATKSYVDNQISGIDSGWTHRYVPGTDET